MKTKLLLGTLSVAATLAVAPAVFADDDDEGTTTPGSVVGTTDAGSDTTYTTNTGTVVIDREFSLTAQREATYTDSEGEEHKYTGFKGVSITTDGTVEGYELTITGEKNEKNGTTTTTTDQNVYFIGANKDGTDSLTITSLEVDNGTSNKSYKTTKSFIVEGCTLTLDGQASENEGVSQLVVTELGMSLNIGTMYDATVNIIDGAQLRTGGYLNTIGSNMATATINISGEGSLLDTQQVTVGGGVSSLFAGTMTSDGDYWTQYLISDADREAVIEALQDPDLKGKVGYGIVNVTEGGTWQVGVGNGDYSISRLQLSNGEVNIDGAGSSLVFGNQSSLVMTATSAFRDSDGNYISTYWTQKVSVTNGGSVTVADGGSLYSLQIGVINYTSNNETAILVDGADENGKVSTLDLSVAGSAYIGQKNSDATGGTEVVTITASKGGVFNITATSAIYIASDSSSYGSYGMDVSLSAESGGSITLTAAGSTSASAVYVGDHSAAEGYQNNLDVRATGDGSKVEISGYNVYAAYISGNTTTSLGAYDGGSLSVVATNQFAFGYGSTEGGSITTTSDGNGSMALSSAYIITNWQTSSDFVSNFVASDGGYLSLTTSSVLYVGYAGGGESNFTATGAGSTLALSCNNVYVNFNTPTDFTSNFTAEDGGSLSVTSNNYIYFGTNSGGYGYGKINIEATGANSLVDISSRGTIFLNGFELSDLSVSVTAKDGGTVKLKTTLSGYGIWLCDNTTVVADNGGTIEFSVNGDNTYLENGAKITITNNSKLISNDMIVYSGSGVSVDATSTWQGGWTGFTAGSSLSISVGASAITKLDGAASANVSFEGTVYFYDTASVTVVIDVSSLGYNESASVAIFSADSVEFNVSDWVGTVLTESNVNAFATGYITADENGYTIDSWSYTNGTLYANITTTPEPSMFSLFLGLAAIALTATRRRRRNQ